MGESLLELSFWIAYRSVIEKIEKETTTEETLEKIKDLKQEIQDKIESIVDSVFGEEDEANG